MSPRIIRAAWAICTVAIVLVAPPHCRADLRFDAVTVDLGDIRSSVAVSREFAFVNNGPEVVELVEARPSCGCLKPRLDTTHFAPGKRGGVALEVNTLGQPAGPHAWQLTLVYKVGVEVKEQTLQVSATVVTEVTVQPAAVTLVVEGALTHELTLTDLRARPLVITAVETTSSWLTAAAGPLVRDAFGNATSKIRLAIAAECPVGRHSESVVIHTSDPTYSALTVPVTVVKREAPACMVTPSEVRLTTGPRLVRVADRFDRAVQVQNVQAGDPAVACTWAAGPHHQATVKLQIDPARWNGETVQTEVRVEIASPEHQVITIPVRIDPVSR
jgi:Protein of unknown function (DUF1573)